MTHARSCVLLGLAVVVGAFACTPRALGAGQPPASESPKPAGNPPADKPAVNADTPLTDAEKPLVGRWTVDTKATIAALLANPKLTEQQRAQAKNGEQMIAQIGAGLALDLLPGHHSRYMGSARLARATWALADGRIKFTMPNGGRDLTLTYSDGKILMPGLGSFPLVLMRQDMPASPKSEQVVGSWKIDMESVRASYERGLSFVGVPAGMTPKQAVDQIMATEGKRFEKLGVILRADGTGHGSIEDQPPHDLTWKVEDDVIILTPVAGNAPRPLVADAYVLWTDGKLRLPAGTGGMIFDFVRESADAPAKTPANTPSAPTSPAKP